MERKTVTIKQAKPQYPVFVLPIFLLLSIPIRMLLKKYNCPIAPNLLLLATSVLFSLGLIMVPEWQKHYIGISLVPPQYLISIFLPVFIVSRIYRMDYYIFIRCLPQVIFISTVGVILNATILGLIIKDILHPKWTFTMGILSGLVAVPIQPNFIITLFKELAKYKYLGTMLETEAIFSYIPVMISFGICLGINENVVSQWYQIVLLVLRYLVGGLIFGLIMGKTTSLLMCWLYNEPIGALCVSIGMAFLTYFSAEFLFAVSGILATVCVVCFMAVEKHRFSSEVDNCIFSFWGTLNYIVEISILMNCAAEIIKHVSSMFEWKDMYGTIITYFSANITRFISFILMGPLLNKLTYDINVRCLMVLGWAGVKGNMNLLLVLLLLSNKSTNVMAQGFLLEMLVYALLSLAINSTSMRLTLQLIGLSELSTTRRTNMNNCMKFIMEKRICIINILKLNRYLSDANWALVRTETMMKHPYKLKMSEEGEEDDEDEFWWNSRNVLCPDCLKEVPLDISEKEMEDMLREAQVKVLKAKKVSVIKQYEKGTINKNCLQVLANTLDIMIESNPRNNTVDLRAYLQKNKCSETARQFLIRLNKDHTYRPPKIQCRRCCFYVMMHQSYDYFFFIAVFSNAVFIILDLLHVIPEMGLWLSSVMWILFFLDFFIKVTGLSYESVCKDGFRSYFKSFWNVFDFWFLVLATVDLVLIFAGIFFIDSGNKEMHTITWILSICRVIRVLRILFFIKGLYPKMIKYVEYRVDTRICFGYDLATAVVNTCDEIIDIIGQLIEVKLIRDIILKQIHEEKHNLIKEMEQVQKERPWIAITVKTKQAIRTTLNAMEEALNELKVSGFVDNIEYAIIYKEIFEKQKFLRNMKFVQPSPPKVIFNEVPWMADDEEIIEYLYNHVEAIAWDAGEVVCRDGKFSGGVYIVVTGLLRLKYSTKDQTLEKLRDYGKIPIVDYLSTLKFDTPMDDNIMSGNSIGELSVLTGRPYDCTIVADSPSQAYLLTSAVIKAAMRINPDPVKGLESRMWKCSTINLAVAVLMDIPLYQSFTQEQIKFKLERAFTPNLRCYKMFVITEMMDDVILLEGVAADYNTGDMFIAPTLIPRTIQKLILPRSSYITLDEVVETRLLIIPMGEAKEYEIMEYEEEIAELASAPSSKCLLHAITDQQAPKQKKKTPAKRKMDKEEDKIFTKESILEISSRTDTLVVEILEPPIEESVVAVDVEVGKDIEEIPLLVANKRLRGLSDDDIDEAGASSAPGPSGLN